MRYTDCTITEIKAYRALEGIPFDFGEGLIYPSQSMESKDTCYEIALQNHEADYYYKQYQYNMRALICASGNWYEDCNSCASDVCSLAGQIKKKSNKYLRNYHYKKKMFKRIDHIEPFDERWHKRFKFSCGYSRSHCNTFAYYDDNANVYIKKIYKSKSIKVLKAYANRCVRRTMTAYGKGRMHCKEYDLWWNYS